LEFGISLEFGAWDLSFYNTPALQHSIAPRKKGGEANGRDQSGSG
jgi:hypothetical protein